MMIPKRILVVDDDADIRELASLILGAVGHKVDCAETTDEAVRLYREARRAGAPYEMLLVDFRLGQEEKGCKLMRRLRDEFGDWDVPFELMSAVAKHPDAEACARDLGCSAIGKPDHFMDLPQIVEKRFAARAGELQPA